MASSSSIVDAKTIALVGVSLLGLYRISQIGKRDADLPPGPPTIPLLGNIHLFPKRSAYFKFTEWAREYGEVYSLKLAHQTMVVISSPSAVRDIMEKHSAVTADRPKFHMAEVITSGGKNIVVSGYNDQWRKLRRGAHDILSPRSCAEHLPIQRAESAQLMHDILTRPKDFYTSIRRLSFSLINSILFGKRAPQFTSPEATKFYHVLHLWEDILEQGAHPPVDLIPILKKTPERYAPWKKLCKEIRKRQIELYFGLLDELEARLKKDESNGCWMEKVIENAEQLDMDRELIGHLAGTLLEASADAVVTFISSFILLMVAFPNVQKKAQEEIDRVIGAGHAPIPSDIENLPYVQALIKEVHRFKPIAPLLFPHASTEDVMYKGYRIPAGSIIFVNNWSISHDSNNFEEPDTFNPDRFLKNKFGVRKEVAPFTADWNEDLAFGVGRRACPGIHLAKSAIGINVVNLLWAFNFNKARDPKTGLEVEADLWNYSTGILAYPNEFKCRITPRSPEHAEIIKQEYLKATDVFVPFEQGLSPEDLDFVTRERQNLA